MKQRPEEVDPAIVAGLKQHGLLHIIEPEKSVDKTAAFALRQTELDDLASDLRKKARQAWKRPASFGLTLAGAAIAASTGHPIGAAVAIGAAALRFESSKKMTLVLTPTFLPRMRDSDN